jgi:tetratricopeptide (TPR) repeat protein
MKKILSVLLLTLFFFHTPFADIIVLKNGKRIEGANLLVNTDTWKQILYRIGTEEKKIDTSEVERIDYGDAPAEYKRGISLYTQGDYKRAIQDFSATLQNSKVRDWVKQYAPYYMGRSYLALGVSKKSNYADAASTLNELLNAFPNAHYLLEALDALGDAYAGNGNYNEANATYDKLIAKAQSEKFATDWELKGKLKKCTLFELSGDFDKAIQEYKSLARSAGRDSPRIANLAKLREGKCYILQAEYTKAVSHFDTLKSNEDLEVVSGAWAGSGFCYFKQGEYDSAYKAYLKYVTRHFQFKEDGAEVYFNIAECIEKLGSSKVPNAKKAGKWYLKRLVDRYPASPEATKARELLK